MVNISKMIIIIPTYRCSNHCRYCMYNKLTYDNHIQTVQQIIDTTTHMLDLSDYVGVAIGGGGDLVQLGYDYCDLLIEQVEHHIVPRLKGGTSITMMTNIHTSDDVQYLTDVVRHHRVNLNISINPERSNNNKTLQLIKLFDQDIKSKIRISTVVLNSIIKQGGRQFLQMIDDLGVGAVLLNQYEKTDQTLITKYPTDHQYFQYLFDAIKLWRNGRYGFDMPQAEDLFINNGMCGIVDVIVDPWAIKIATLNNKKQRQLISVDVNKIDEAVKQSVRRIFDRKCMGCKHLSVCEHKYTQNCIDPHVCQIIDQMILSQ